LLKGVLKNLLVRAGIGIPARGMVREIQFPNQLENRESKLSHSKTTFSKVPKPRVGINFLLGWGLNLHPSLLETALRNKFAPISLGSLGLFSLQAVPQLSF
jgi:hypothetical protein